MGTYFFNDYDIKKSDLFIEKVDEPEGVQEDYASGISIDLKGNKPKYFYKRKDSHKLDLVPGIQYPPIISSALKTFLEKQFADQLEFHPAELICLADETTDSSYFLLNLLNVIECVDKGESEFTLFHPDHNMMVTIDKLVLDDTKITDADIFRVQEHPSLIVYSKKAKTSIEKQDFKGFNFLEVSEYESM